jgi:tetratricopeptide (TPR) repeat protein
MPICRALVFVATLLAASLGVRGVLAESAIFSLTTEPLQAESKPLAEHPLTSRAEHRELGRQAVLLAAREELGCATRDQSLGERIDEATQNVFEASIESRHGQGLRIVVRRGDEAVYDHEVEDPIGPIFDIQRLAQKLEPLTRGELADALEKAGIERRSIKPRESVLLPTEIDPLLGRMDHLSQHNALRLLHSTARDQGESPELIAATARAYANLAMLNVTSLDARCVAYRARAMLYAERLRSRAPADSTTAWTLAYVYTLIGYPTIALDSLAASGESAKANPPDWLEVVLDGCHHRFNELATVAYDSRDGRAELAAVLLMRSAATSGSMVLAIQTGVECQKTSPGCLWINDAVDSVSGVSKRHETTVVGPELHWNLLTTGLAEMVDIPVALDGVDAEYDSESSPAEIAKLAQQLIDAEVSDDIEPSWGALGADIQAWMTLHVYRRAEFLRNMIGWDPTDYLTDMKPAFDKDPWASAVLSLGVPRNGRVAEYDAALADFELFDVNNLSSANWLWSMPRRSKFKNGSVNDVISTMSGARGASELEYATVLATDDLQQRVRYARWMLDSSKHAPQRIAILIRDNPSATDEEVAELANEYGEHPVVALALGERAAARDENEQAIGHYQSYLKRAPDATVFRKLAKVYYRQKDPRWMETLEEVFEYEDYSLSHASAAATIAMTLLKEGSFEKAATWASIASESGAGWAWQVECECRAALGQYEQVVQLAEQNTHRYGNDAWFRWSAMCGEGDLTAALDWQLKQPPSRQSPSGPYATALAFASEGKDRECVDLLLQWEEKAPSEWGEIMIALVADRLGDTKVRDECLAKAAARADDQQKNVYALIAAELKKAYDSGAVDKVLAPEIVSDAEQRRRWAPIVNYYSGFYYSNRGDKAAAIEKWQASVSDTADTVWPRDFATIELRRAGGEPFRIKGRQLEYALR